MRLIQRGAPALFVVLWSTGFIVARYSTRDAGPLTFLAIRTAIAAAVLMVASRVVGEQSLARNRIGPQIAVGVGMHAMYLGGVFVAIDHGLPSGVSALIAALHPVLTSVGARYILGETLSLRRALGVGLGMAGVLAVVVERGGVGDGVSAVALVAMTVAVVGMSGGTLVQRRHGEGVPLLMGTVVQYGATAAVLGVGAVAVEGWDVHFTRYTVGSLIWAVGVLSIAAVLIMLWLLRRQAAARVSSLFFLTPAFSTVEGALLFGERLGPLAMGGLGVAMAGVYLAAGPVRNERADPAISPRR